MFVKRSNTLFILVVLSGLFSSALALNPSQSSLAKPSTLEYVQFAENEIANWFDNAGHLTTHIVTGDAGCEWPVGSEKHAVFASGIWVVGKVEGELRSAAAEFTSEWTPGTIPYDTELKVPSSATPIDTPLDQIYYIQDGNSSDPYSDSYSWEYANWPSGSGAPAHDGEVFEDLNGNNTWDVDESYEDFNQDGEYNPPDGVFVTGEDPPSFRGIAMAWYVMNDWSGATHNNLWGTDPLGVETHVLTYVVDGGPLYDNVQFNEIKLINKSGLQIDSTFYSYWSDVDLGDATDDQVGCDSTLSLGYYYNGNLSDQDYGLTPPAVGYDFLQGPMVESPGESVWHGDQEYPDKKILDMTAFYFFISSSPAYGDPEAVWETFYLMQGLTPGGNPALDPWGNATTFLLSGDPVESSGWIAGDYFNPTDKRALMSTGPFTLPTWDDTNGNSHPDFGEPGVQVIHGALEIISGANNLDAVTNLKYLCEYIQFGFNRDFDFPQIESQANLSASSHDQEIILNWNSGSAALEMMSWGAYEFEGYEVFQGSSLQGPWTKIKTFDVVNDVGIIQDQNIDAYGILQDVVVHYGDNIGLEHLLSIQKDTLSGGSTLVNGQNYYFALRAYAYNELGYPKSISSELQTLSIQPGTTIGAYLPRDTLEVTHTGNGEVLVSVAVMDPGQLSGDDYEIGFDYDSSTMQGGWHLLRMYDDITDTLMIGSDPLNEVYVDGLELSLNNLIFENPRVNTSWAQTVNVEGNHLETLELLAVSPGGVDSLAWSDETMTNMVHLDTLVGYDNYWEDFEIDIRGAESWFILTREILHSVDIHGFASTYGAIGGDHLADIPGVGGGSDNLEFLQADLELRFTEEGQNGSIWTSSAGYVPYLVNLPFEVWDLERDIQLCVGIRDVNRTGGIQDTSLDGWENTLDWDWVVVYDRDYAVYGDSLQEFTNNPYSGWSWQFNNSSVFSLGDVVYLSFLNPVSPGYDIYQWTTSGAAPNQSEPPVLPVSREIKIFPNPFNPSTTIQYGLPKSSGMTLTIYDILGRSVWTYAEAFKPAGYYSMQWNGLNNDGYRVASGVYIISVATDEFRVNQKAMLIR